MLEQVEKASANLRAVHAALWKAYEGISGIQDMFGKVTDVNRTVDTIRNKLSVLRDAKELRLSRTSLLNARSTRKPRIARTVIY